MRRAFERCGLEEKMASEKRGIGSKPKASAPREPQREPKRTIGRGAKPSEGAHEKKQEHERDARHDEKHDREPEDRAHKSEPDAEPSFREMAGHASRRLGKLFDDAKEKAGPTARKVGEFLEEAKAKAGPAARSAADATKKVAVDLEGGLDEAFGTISAQARDLMAKGQHTRVRIKFRGRQLTELPIAVVAAAEAASLWWFGPLRLLLGHVVGKSVLDVEFVSNADAHVAEGRAQLADGELDKALAAFDKALSMDRKCAAAWLGRGVALKLRGDKPGAKAAFEEAESCDPHGESGRAQRLDDAQIVGRRRREFRGELRARDEVVEQRRAGRGLQKHELVEFRLISVLQHHGEADRRRRRRAAEIGEVEARGRLCRERRDGRTADPCRGRRSGRGQKGGRGDGDESGNVHSGFSVKKHRGCSRS